jgi:NADH dehydrogenase FAD-containing subunit
MVAFNSVLSVSLHYYQIPSNFVLWSTGIAMNPFTARVSSLLPNQVHRKAIETDSHLRVKGAPLGDVYAIGDCATVGDVSWKVRNQLILTCDF